MERALHIGTKVDPQLLLSHPEEVVQRLSIKVFQRYQELLRNLRGQQVFIDRHGQLRAAQLLELAEHGHAVVLDLESGTRRTVPLRQVHLPS